VDRSCERCSSTTKSQGEEEYPENNKKKGKANWIGHMFRRNFILKQII